MAGFAECGLFGIQEDYEEGVLSLDELMIKSQVSTFFFRASGTSMEPTIFNGDILVVDTSLKPSHGKVVVCELNGERLCKRLFLRPKRLLMSDNNRHRSIEVTEEVELLVFGVVTGVARKL